MTAEHINSINNTDNNTDNTAAVRPTLESEIRNAFVGFDETSLMRFNGQDQQPTAAQLRFLRQIDEATAVYRRRVWISADTLKHLERETASAGGVRLEAANNAMALVRKLHETDRLQIVDHQSPYEDIDSGREIMIICSQMRRQSAERLTVFTQYPRLADALLDMNRTEQLGPKERISVFRVSANGYMTTFLKPEARTVPLRDQFAGRLNEQGYEVLTRPRTAPQAAYSRFGPLAIEERDAGRQPERAPAMYNFRIQPVGGGTRAGMPVPPAAPLPGAEWPLRRDD